jgi:hypothetical protein
MGALRQSNETNSHIINSNKKPSNWNTTPKEGQESLVNEEDTLSRISENKLV